MKRLLSAVAAFALALPALGQSAPNFVNIITSSACITDVQGNPLDQGTVQVYSVDQNNQPRAVSIPGTMIALTGPEFAPLSAGQLLGALKLPNPLVTSPFQIGYTFTFSGDGHSVTYQKVPVTADGSGNFDLCLLAAGLYGPSSLPVSTPGGLWNGSTAYQPGSVVKNAYDNNTYVALQGNSATAPGSNNAIWWQINTNGGTGSNSGGSSYTLTAAEINAITGLTISTTGNAAKVGGVAITGTPSPGQVPTATSAGTATWQTPATGGGGGGTAATVTVGSVATLSPGSSATVTNVGTSSAAVLNFGIPAGAAGAGGGGSFTLTTAEVTALGALTNNTSGNAATATGLAATPTHCTSPQVPTGVDVHGNAIGCATPSGGGSGASYPVHLTVLGDSMTCGYELSDGVCPFPPSFPTTPSPHAYPALVGAAMGLTVSNEASSGDQACDLFPNDINRFGLMSHVDGNPIYIVQIGTNDGNVKGVGSYEAIFELCHKAVLSWLAAGRENMVLPGDAAMTGAGAWVATSTTVATNAAEGTSIYGASASGAGTLTVQLNTFGEPIYGWYLIDDAASSGSCFNVSVDGGSSSGPYCTQTSPAISTQNGTTASVGFLRIPAISGAHTIVATTTTGGVAIVGFGTPATNNYYGHPVIASNELPNWLNANPAMIAQYTADIKADESLLIPDNNDIRHVYNQLFMLGTPAEMVDQIHPDLLGHTHLAQAQLSVLQPSALSATSSSGDSALPFAYTTVASTGGGTTTTIGDTNTSENTPGGAGYGNILLTPLTAGTLASVSMNFPVAPDGTSPVEVVVLQPAGGNNYTLTNNFNVVPTASSGIQTFTSFVNFDVTAGEVIGFYAPTGGANPGILRGVGNQAYEAGVPSGTIAYTPSSGTPSISAVITTGGGAGVSGIVPTSSTISVPGMTASGHCVISGTNSSAAAQPAWVSSVASNQITINNAAVANLSYEGVCTAN